MLANIKLIPKAIASQRAIAGVELIFKRWQGTNVSSSRPRVVKWQGKASSALSLDNCNNRQNGCNLTAQATQFEEHHSMQSERDYLIRRAQDERASADSATSAASRHLHLDLCARYEARAAALITERTSVWARFWRSRGRP